MDSTIIAAIIGGAFTLVSSGITFLLARHLDDRNNQVMSSNRQAIMTGTWKGELHQESGSLSTSPVTVTLIAKRRVIRGSIRVQDPNNGEAEYKATGGFLYGRFIRLNYDTTDHRRVQFGSIVMELSPDGNKLSGKYTGYGAFSQSIVSGYFEATRS
jgi:hypothetical protein